jgi:hypothetical protein
MDWFTWLLFGCIVLLNVALWIRMRYTARPSRAPLPASAGTSERFRVEPRGTGLAGFTIWWGPTHICEVFTDRETAERLCAILEALRAVDNGGDPERIETAWRAFCDARNQGR